MELRKFVLHLDAGIPGTDMYEPYLVPTTVTAKDMEDYARQRAIEHAEMYGIYHPQEEGDEDDDEDADDEYETLYQSYWDNVGGSWEPYDSDKHDGLILCASGSEISWSNY